MMHQPAARRLPRKAARAAKVANMLKKNAVRAVCNREKLIVEANELVLQALPQPSPDAARQFTNLAQRLRTAGLRCVQAIVGWVLDVSETSDIPKQFLWNGENYLLKMHTDLDFVYEQLGRFAWDNGHFSRGNPLLLSSEETKGHGPRSELGRLHAASVVIKDVVYRTQLEAEEEEEKESVANSRRAKDSRRLQPSQQSAKPVRSQRGAYSKDPAAGSKMPESTISDRRQPSSLHKPRDAAGVGSSQDNLAEIAASSKAISGTDDKRQRDPPQMRSRQDAELTAKEAKASRTKHVDQDGLDDEYSADFQDTSELKQEHPGTDDATEDNHGLQLAPEEGKTGVSQDTQGVSSSETGFTPPVSDPEVERAALRQRRADARAQLAARWAVPRISEKLHRCIFVEQKDEEDRGVADGAPEAKVSETALSSKNADPEEAIAFVRAWASTMNARLRRELCTDVSQTEDGEDVLRQLVHTFQAALSARLRPFQEGLERFLTEKPRPELSITKIAATLADTCPAANLEAAEHCRVLGSSLACIVDEVDARLDTLRRQLSRTPEHGNAVNAVEDAACAAKVWQRAESISSWCANDVLNGVIGLLANYATDFGVPAPQRSEALARIFRHMGLDPEPHLWAFLLNPFSKNVMLNIDLLRTNACVRKKVAVSRTRTLDDTFAMICDSILDRHGGDGEPSNILALFPYFKSTFGTKVVDGVAVEEGEGAGPRKELFALVSQQAHTPWTPLDADAGRGASERESQVQHEHGQVANGSGMREEKNTRPSSVQRPAAKPNRSPAGGGDTVQAFSLSEFSDEDYDDDDVMLDDDDGAFRPESAAHQQTPSNRDEGTLRQSTGSNADTQGLFTASLDMEEGSNRATFADANVVRDKLHVGMRILASDDTTSARSTSQPLHPAEFVVTRVLDANTVQLDRMSPRQFRNVQVTLWEPRTAEMEFRKGMQAFWINRQTPYSENMAKRFEALGALMALAVVNGCRLDMRMPRAFFELMLRPATSAREVSAVLARDDPEFAAALAKAEQLEERELEQLGYSRDQYRVELIDSAVGGSTAVAPSQSGASASAGDRSGLTADSQGLWQFRSLHQGFQHIVPPNKLRSFRVLAADLVPVVGLGSERLEDDFDFRDFFLMVYDEELQSTENLALLDAFWDVVSAFSPEQKRSLLQFITGVTHLPFPRAEYMTIELSFEVVPGAPRGDILDKLPQAHTCDNVLELPNYWGALKAQGATGIRGSEKLHTLLREKLLLAALHGSSSYGLDQVAAPAGAAAPAPVPARGGW